ncbi:MAG TPA: DUF4252 domain-containing protein [Thermoanaerobaculia bacterium]|nr:DUF4252 domain-containing protein [Thermoanaerobaculia bacterium]
MRKTIILVVILLVLGTAAGQAQKLTDQPGYVPLEQLDLFPKDKLSLEINIEGALMSLIAAGAKNDPEFSSLMAGLKSITVQAIPLKGMDEATVRTKIGRTVRWLEDRGWKSTMRMRDKGEEAYIYLREVDGKIAGMTLLTLDPGQEAVVINIVGRIDPAQIGRLSQRLNLPQIKHTPAPAPPPGKKPE